MRRVGQCGKGIGAGDGEGGLGVGWWAPVSDVCLACQAFTDGLFYVHVCLSPSVCVYVSVCPIHRKPDIQGLRLAIWKEADAFKQTIDLSGKAKSSLFC